MKLSPAEVNFVEELQSYLPLNIKTDLPLMQLFTSNSPKARVKHMTYMKIHHLQTESLVIVLSAQRSPMRTVQTKKSQKFHLRCRQNQNRLCIKLKKFETAQKSLIQSCIEESAAHVFESTDYCQPEQHSLFQTFQYSQYGKCSKMRSPAEFRS